MIYTTFMSMVVLTTKHKEAGGHLLSEDDHSHWAPPYWNIMKLFLRAELNSKSNCKNVKIRVLGMYIKK